jgi:mRNA turnover protein 4
MRNEGLKELRSQWRGTGRFFLGRGKVMAKSLGETEETEYQEGLAKLARVSGGSRRRKTRSGFT